MQKKIRALFLQSQGQTWSWSIADVHRMILRHFNREQVEIHSACAIGPRGAKTPAYTRFEAIPDLHLRPTNFGPEIFGSSKSAVVKNLLITGFATPGSLIGLINYVKQHQIDIIHSAEIPRDALCNIFLAKMTGAKSVIHIHTKCASWMRPAVFRAMKQADGIIGVSAFVADSAIAIGCQPNRVYHTLNSIDASQWNERTDGSPIRQEFRIPPDALIFTIVGRVAQGKGHELVLKALAHIKDRIPDFRFMIVGEDTPDPLTGHSNVTDLQELARGLELSQQVIFTGLRSDIQTILAASDLYTMPTLEEGFCLAILEAMAMKKAVIALDSGGPREFVEHGKAGLLSQPGDVEQLAENILTLVKDTNLRQQMGAYARRRVEDYLNPQRLANDVEQIYRLILGDTDTTVEREAVASATV